MILVLRNRQQRQCIDIRYLKQIVAHVLTDLAGVQQAELGIQIVSARKMSEVNQRYLGHQGATDVITFDHSTLELVRSEKPARVHSSAHDETMPLKGELFICMDEAMLNAQRFRTSWQLEVARYVVHGILHLRGYDDSKPMLRRRMKREENRWMRSVAKRFPLSALKKSHRP